MAQDRAEGSAAQDPTAQGAEGEGAEASGDAAEGPQRIVTLVPSATELLFAIGAGDRVVGRSAHCDYPPEASAIPSVGSGLTPDLERLFALEPDLVVGTALQQGQPYLTSLEEAEIPVILLADQTIPDIAASLAVLGRELGEVDAARALVEEIERTLLDVQARMAEGQAPRTLVVLGRDPLFAAGSASYIGQTLEIAGGDNVFDGDWVQVDDEVLLHFDPELIIEGNDAPNDAFWDRYASMSAVRDGRICRVDGGVMGRPGPRVVETAAAFARCVAAMRPTTEGSGAP